MMPPSSNLLILASFYSLEKNLKFYQMPGDALSFGRRNPYNKKLA